MKKNKVKRMYIKEVAELKEDIHYTCIDFSRFKLRSLYMDILRYLFYKNTDLVDKDSKFYKEFRSSICGRIYVELFDIFSFISKKDDIIPYTDLVNSEYHYIKDIEEEVWYDTLKDVKFDIGLYYQDMTIFDKFKTLPKELSADYISTHIDSYYDFYFKYIKTKEDIKNGNY